MVVLQAFLALVAGFATMMVLVLGITALLAFILPSWEDADGKPKAGYAFANLGCSFLAAAAGGYVTAWIAAANPLVHVLALGIVVLALAALSVIQSRGRQAIWYQLSLVAVSPLGVLAGGLVRLRVLGII